MLDRVIADVAHLEQFDDGSFDAAVCYGGPISYLVDRAEEGIAELVRVTRPGGHVLLSVMSLVGAVTHFTSRAARSRPPRRRRAERRDPAHGRPARRARTTATCR